MMKIAVIGTGYVGGTLTRCFSKLGHNVSITNLNNDNSSEILAIQTGANLKSIMEVADEAEVVIISIPIENIPTLPPGFLEKTAPGAAIIDTTNYYPLLSGNLIEPIEMGMTESHWVELQINHPVIKAFNTIPWFDLTSGLSKDNPRRLATPIAGDDPVAKNVVCKLVDELGFDAVDAGGLEHSWRQQLGTSAFFAELDASDLRIALSEALPERGYGIKAIHLSDNELKAEQEINSFFYKEIVRAVHILMEYNDLTEAEAMKSLCIHITTGNMLAHEILDCIFENKRLHKAQLSL